MQLFKLKTRLSKFDHFADFAREFKLSEHDLVITNEFLYDPFMKSLNLPCHFIMQEKFGLGEPSDKMMNTILKEVKGVGFDRVIAVGGGTVSSMNNCKALVSGKKISVSCAHGSDAYLHAVNITGV